MDSRCVAESLREVFFEHGLPKKVSVTSLQLFRELEEYFNLQGIEVDCNTEHPALEMVAKDLDFDSDQLPDPLEMLEALQQKPEDDDLDEWFYLKMYSFSIITLLSISKGNRLFESGTAKYVNDIDRKSLTEDPISIEFMKSLVVYFIFSALKEDSSGSGIKSLSEKSAGLYLFLQCFRNSKLSIYKILNISSQDTEKIRLKDVFTEQIVCIDYASGHNEAAEGDYIAAIVYNLGNFTFSDAISPIFNQPQIDEAIKELESMGMPSKNQSSWLEENAYIFGKFWKRYIKQ